MKTQIKDGGPAFPKVQETLVDGLTLKTYTPPQTGMSLRDWFAGMALQGIVSNSTMTENPNYDRPGAAHEAYELADAMLAEREKGLL